MSSDEDFEETFMIKKKVKREEPPTRQQAIEALEREENERKKMQEENQNSDAMIVEETKEPGTMQIESKNSIEEENKIEEEEEEEPEQPKEQGQEQEQEQRPRFDPTGMQMAEQTHTAFYEGKKNIQTFERRNLKTILLRNYHNWIKSVLIKKYTDKVKKNFESRSYGTISVLDVGCGTGGDLGKWGPNGIAYYLGVDISRESVQLAYERWSEKPGPKKFAVDFINVSGAAKEEVFYKNIHENAYFDLVSSQFVIHYMFSQEQYVENLFSNISKRLLKNGYFICSVPDADVMVKRIRTKGVKNENGELVLGNEHYSIKFKNDKFPKNQPYGIEYGFFLDDAAVGSKTVEDGKIKITYVPEYLIIPENCKKVAKKYDLELVEERNFHDFCKESIKDKEFFELMKRLKIENIEDIPHDLWEISYLYKVMAFKKTSGQDMNKIDRNFKRFAGNKVTIQEDFEEEKEEVAGEVKDSIEDDLFDSSP